MVKRRSECISDGGFKCDKLDKISHLFEIKFLAGILSTWWIPSILAQLCSTLTYAYSVISIKKAYLVDKSMLTIKWITSSLIKQKLWFDKFWLKSKQRKILKCKYDESVSLFLS